MTIQGDACIACVLLAKGHLLALQEADIVVKQSGIYSSMYCNDLAQYHSFRWGREEW